MSDLEQPNPQSMHYRIRREAQGAWAWFRANWRSNRGFRWIVSILFAILLLYFLVWFLLARNLPDANMLLRYEPPLPTMVRGVDGEIVDSYARERRVQLQFRDFPPQLIGAYLSAEDKSFWTHGGVDVTGFAGAVLDYVTKFGTGARAGWLHHHAAGRQEHPGWRRIFDHSQVEGNDPCPADRKGSDKAADSGTLSQRNPPGPP